MALPLKKTTGKDDLLRERSQRLHQAALATGGVVLVNDAFFSGLIQAADGFQNGFARGGNIAGGNRKASIAHGGARRTTEGAVA